MLMGLHFLSDSAVLGLNALTSLWWESKQMCYEIQIASAVHNEEFNCIVRFCCAVDLSVNLHYAPPVCRWMRVR